MKDLTQAIQHVIEAQRRTEENGKDLEVCIDSTKRRILAGENTDDPKQDYAFAHDIPYEVLQDLEERARPGSRFLAIKQTRSASTGIVLWSYATGQLSRGPVFDAQAGRITLPTKNGYFAMPQTDPLTNHPAMHEEGDYEILRRARLTKAPVRSLWPSEPKMETVWFADEISANANYWAKPLESAPELLRELVAYLPSEPTGK